MAWAMPDLHRTAPRARATIGLRSWASTPQRAMFDSLVCSAAAAAAAAVAGNCSAAAAAANAASGYDVAASAENTAEFIGHFSSRSFLRSCALLKSTSENCEILMHACSD